MSSLGVLHGHKQFLNFTFECSLIPCIIRLQSLATVGTSNEVVDVRKNTIICASDFDVLSFLILYLYGGNLRQFKETKFCGSNGNHKKCASLVSRMSTKFLFLQDHIPTQPAQLLTKLKCR
jgi:hypothetical protein